MSAYLTRTLQLTLLSTGLALTIGSSSKSKNKSTTSITLNNPRCSALRPSWLKQSADRLALSCKYDGGEAESKFTKAKDAKCSDGTFLHGVVVTCNGAHFDRKLLPTKRSAVSKLPSPAEKAAMAKAMIEEQNRYRTALNLQPLKWSDRLAEFAAKWAEQLASMGGERLLHSNPRTTGQGENIWIGASGTSFAQMIRDWADEKSNFINGIFPNVSKTRDTNNVRNYTQMIWGATTLVGCAVIRVGNKYILVCRYWTPGNIIGQKPY